jgi:hypothetical protein
MPHARTISGLLPLLGAIALLSACDKEEGTPKLFDEQGAWTLIRYDVEGEGNLRTIDSMNRKDAFMLKFDVENAVVQTAACIDEDGGSVTPSDSPCLLTPTDTEWVCSCFGYAFENDKMKWREFDAGNAPPMVSFEEDGGNQPPAGGDDAAGTGTGGGDGGDDGGPAPGSDFTITVAEVADVSATYTFLPLPTGIFGSNGSNSRYIFQARAPSLFDRAFEDPDGRATCEPCI